MFRGSKQLEYLFNLWMSGDGSPVTPEWLAEMFHVDSGRRDPWGALSAADWVAQWGVSEKYWAVLRRALQPEGWFLDAEFPEDFRDAFLEEFQSQWGWMMADYLTARGWEHLDGSEIPAPDTRDYVVTDGFGVFAAPTTRDCHLRVTDCDSFGLFAPPEFSDFPPGAYRIEFDSETGWGWLRLDGLGD